MEVCPQKFFKFVVFGEIDALINAFAKHMCIALRSSDAFKLNYQKNVKRTFGASLLLDLKNVFN